LRSALLATSLVLGATAAQATSLRLCDHAAPVTARQQDRLLRFAAIVRGELQASGHSVALISRSGLDLKRFGIRYSHAGISLQTSDNSPWSVRQLYYACEEGRPRLFDQGLPGFLMGGDNPDLGYIAIVLMPQPDAALLEQAARDKPRALQLLAGTYSANAHAYALRYQNCNQWVAELLAAAWGQLPAGAQPRAQAQAWLAEQGYAPPPVQVGSHLLMFAGAFVPWIHYDDHPESDRYALRFQTSLPSAIEAFVRQRQPAAQRIEFCHNRDQVVIHRGWQPVAEGCVAQEGDTVLALD
jgi:hypothetical protein